KEMIIEERNPNEIIKIKDQFIAPEESKTFNPAFDVTPNELITAIITDKKAYTKPFEFDI
ncbi:MAG: S-methyl-5-thioribose-1-phosphate isomerase, partial [Candidatus Cloacimonetes bacterium]|nr:S-methyl-5-thioribose-1-phosphate isomerase [Candidatus Cloacimonadota bacterium]